MRKQSNSVKVTEFLYCAVFITLFGSSATKQRSNKPGIYIPGVITPLLLVSCRCHYYPAENTVIITFLHRWFITLLPRNQESDSPMVVAEFLHHPLAVNRHPPPRHVRQWGGKRSGCPQQHENGVVRHPKCGRSVIVNCSASKNHRNTYKYRNKMRIVREMDAIVRRPFRTIDNTHAAGLIIVCVRLPKGRDEQ